MFKIISFSLIVFVFILLITLIQKYGEKDNYLYKKYSIGLINVLLACSVFLVYKINSFPDIDKLFQDNDLILSHFLTGIIEKNSLKNSPFVKDTIWTEYTINRLLLQNSNVTPHRKKYKIEVFLLGSGFDGDIHKQIISFDCDVNLINYNFQCCESEFRKALEYESLVVEDPVGYRYTSVSGDFYAMPVEKDVRIKWANYYALYPRIRKIIKKTVQEYFNSKNLKNL